MFEKVSPSHPDKIADRIAGAIVDLAYAKEDNPKVAVEVLIGHGKCHIINETSVKLSVSDINKIVKRIAKEEVEVDYQEVPQDPILASNQEKFIRCGDNGIFHGVPIKSEEKYLTSIVRDLYTKYPSDSKFIYDEEDNKLIVCQSNVNSVDLMNYLNARYSDIKTVIINPLGDWTGGINVDTGVTNRKLGSDMGRAATGGGLCLSGNSEFISSDFKWHKISEWNGEKVGQWNNGKLEFVNPLKYIHNTHDTIIKIYNSSKLSMELTPSHQMLIETSKNHLIKKEAKFIAEKLSAQKGNSGKIIHNFQFEHSPQKSQYADEEEYRLQVAFCADGTLLKDTVTWNGRIRVKKEYKKNRLRTLLKNKKYKETQDGDYSIFWIKVKKPNKSLYECFKEENWEILYDEVFKWDGDVKRKIFRTTKKEDADFIQFVIQSFNKNATIKKDNKLGKPNGKYITQTICYTVQENKFSRTSLRKSKGIPIYVEYLENQHSYCFEVPSHNLVIRNNDKIFITGNCGKDISKSDVSVNIVCHLLAQQNQTNVYSYCAIGDDTLKFTFSNGNNIVLEYSDVVQRAKTYISGLGGFEKLAEWGLI